MTNEELLAKAERDYPVGTKHNGWNGSGFKVTSCNFIFIYDNIYSSGDVGCIYYGETETWAEIISLPKPKEIIFELW